MSGIEITLTSVGGSDVIRISRHLIKYFSYLLGGFSRCSSNKNNKIGYTQKRPVNCQKFFNTHTHMPNIVEMVHFVVTWGEPGEPSLDTFF